MRLDYNKLYHFRYKAKGEGQLHVYDKVPIIFIIDVRPNNSILAVNFHWIPFRIRRKFFDAVREIMDKTEMVGKKVERMRLTYELLKKPEYRTGLQAIRMYYVQNMTAVKVIPEATWNLVFGYGIKEYRMRKVYKRTGYKD
jgi:hypothetical protein